MADQTAPRGSPAGKHDSSALTLQEATESMLNNSWFSVLLGDCVRAFKAAAKLQGVLQWVPERGASFLMHALALYSQCEAARAHPWRLLFPNSATYVCILRAVAHGAPPITALPLPSEFRNVSAALRNASCFYGY